MDGEQRVNYISTKEALRILDGFGNNSASVMIGKSDYILIYDACRKLVIDGEAYLPSGYLVMKSCNGLQAIDDEDIADVIAALRAIARERSRKSAEKRKQRAENDPEYAKYLEERNTEYNRRHTARRKEQMETLRARAEAGDQEAQSQLAERKQYQVRATVKSYRKMREDALNGDSIAKEKYEKTLAMRREAYHAKKSEQTA